MKITESQIEKFAIELHEKQVAIELHEKQGYQYIYAPDIAPDSETPERSSFEDVLLVERLKKAVGRITQNKAKTIDTNDDQGINNKQIHTLEKLRDTLLPKLMSGEVRVKLEQEGGDI
jgi:type I restriction enzyme R subunit